MNDSRPDKIKVFIDCRWYAQSGQGAVTYIDGLQRATERLLATDEFRDRRIEFWYGVESIALTPANLFLPHDRAIELGQCRLPWRLLGLPFLLRREGFAAAHFTYMCPLIRNGVAYVTSIHDVLFLRHPRFFSPMHRMSRRLLYGLSARRSDVVLTISEQSRRDIQELLGRQAPISILPCGPGPSSTAMDTVAQPVEGLTAGRFFLSVGRVEPRKNFPALVRAFERSGLAAEGAQLALVGFCSEEFAAERPHLEGRPGVRWLSRVSDAELKWLYANARAFVFPSFCEGFGIPVIEAMQAALPVAVADTYPLADVLEAADERFDPSDESQMAASLTRLWSAPDTARAPPAVLRRYTWENAARAYLAALAPLERLPASRRSAR